MQKRLYTVETLIGEGSGGTVYRARSKNSSEACAVKSLKKNSPEALSRFQQEVRYLSKLRHPGLVAVIGFSPNGEEIEGLPAGPCYWMEHVDGTPIREAAEKDSRRLVSWLTEALEALDYLHAQGILHGDIKPDNLRIDTKGHIRLLDFGLSSSIKDPQRANTIQGSLPYLAPEAARGETSEGSDLYALGTVFYEVAVGRHPRAHAQTLQDLFSPDFKSLAEEKTHLPRNVARVIDRMIEGDPALRFKTAKEALAALSGTLPAKPAHETQSFRLYGREREWSLAQAFVSSPERQSVSLILLLHGATGTGKTRLGCELLFHFLLNGRKARLENMDGFQKAPEIFHFLNQGETDRQEILILEYNDDQLSPEQTHFFQFLMHDARVLNLSLHDLSFEDASGMLRDLLRKEVPESISKRIFEQTHGNPGLVSQAARQILSSGFLSLKRPTAKNVENLLLPDHFEKALQQRLGELPEAESKILAWICSSPEGGRLTDLIALSGFSPASLHAHLLSLENLGLTHHHEDGHWTAAFEAVRDLVLNELPTPQRDSIHRAWIGHLETGWPNLDSASPDVLNALAHHGLSLTPPHPKSSEWTQKAGEGWSARKEEARAIKLYERCLRACSETQDREPLLRHLANAYGNLGDFRKSLKATEDWFQIVPKDPEGLNPVKYWLSTAVACKNLGEVAEARRRLAECLKAGDVSRPAHRQRLGRAHSLLGFINITERKCEDAAKCFEEAHRLLMEPSEQKAEVYKHQAMLASEMDRWTEALQCLGSAEGVYRALGSVEGLFSCALERGNLAFHRRPLEDIESAYASALKIAAEASDEHLLARVYHNLGVLACRRGDFVTAFDELEKARELFLFFGSPEEQGLNLLQIALAQAFVGRSAEADITYGQAVRLSRSAAFVNRAQEVSYEIETAKKGKVPNRPCPFTFEQEPQPWDLEYRWLAAMIKGQTSSSPTLRDVLHRIYGKLSAPLKLSFEERMDVRDGLHDNRQTSPEERESRGGDMTVVRKFNAITRDLLGSKNMDEVLKQIMQAAVELSRAERGFLVVRTGRDTGGPLPGFGVKASKNMSPGFQESEDFRLSLTAVREVLRTGSPLVTDNALLDQRFKTAESVSELELKSILVLPLRASEEWIGVLSLDHTYETDIFRGADLDLLQMFADQAALALQKAQMIEELKAANSGLEEKVSSQSQELTFLKKEVEKQRLKLTREYAEIIGQSPAMLEVLSLVDRLVDTAIPVWIFGESGTGKEMIARALHYKGPRAKAAFVSENCSSLPEHLLESELFGHKKGAFTHAERDKKGLLHHANGGTVFLDEIADMSPALQAKMLRFLQEGEIRPVGSNETVKVDVRVVSASNKDLQQLIKEGKFREDLFYRLNGMTVTLPPLRERVEDIPILVSHFLKKIADADKKEPLEISPEALELLTEYEWPGNVRELENTIRSACLFQYKGKLLPKSFHFKKALMGDEGIRVPVSGSGGKNKAETMDERRILLKALRDNHFHKGETAEALGISRRYLYTQMSKHGIPTKRVSMKAFVEKELG